MSPLQMTISNDSVKLRVFHRGKLVKERDSVSYVNGSMHTGIVAPIVDYRITYVYVIVRKILGLKTPLKLYYKRKVKVSKREKH